MSARASVAWLAMAAVPTHPFAVDVRPLQLESRVFTWSIKRRGEVMGRSIAPHTSFEAARLEMKAALNLLIVSWEAGR